MPITSFNPATGQPIQSYTAHTPQQVQEKITQTQEAWLAWRFTPMDTRTEKLLQLATVLRSRKQELATLMAQEMGKPVKQGLAEVEKCARCCEYYAEHAAIHLQDQLIPTEASKSYVSFQPLGIILAIMPWNFPLWQVIRFLAPALSAGNAALLKHASNVPGCAIAIEEMVNEAGFPAHLFQTLLISSKEVNAVLEHPKVMAATGPNSSSS